jgi:hypothetical protein
MPGQKLPDSRHEPNIAPDSGTERSRLGIDTWRWTLHDLGQSGGSTTSCGACREQAGFFAIVLPCASIASSTSLVAGLYSAVIPSRRGTVNARRMLHISTADLRSKLVSSRPPSAPARCLPEKFVDGLLDRIEVTVCLAVTELDDGMLLGFAR